MMCIVAATLSRQKAASPVSVCVSSPVSVCVWAVKNASQGTGRDCRPRQQMPVRAQAGTAGRSNKCQSGHRPGLQAAATNASQGTGRDCRPRQQVWGEAEDTAVTGVTPATHSDWCNTCNTQ
ncbi:hypothetical protein ACOMHN_048180 [Nucella lapillus]